MSDISQATSRSPPAPASLDLARVLLEGRAFFALIVIIVVFSILSPNYFTVSNFLTMANHVAIYGLLSIGMLLVILNGGIDLSVGSVAGAVRRHRRRADAGRDAQCVRRHALSAGVGGGGLTCALGAFVGALNGVLIAYLKVPAFVATLGTLYVARGVALLMTNGLTYNNLGGTSRARQYRLRLARLQPHRRRADRRDGAGGRGGHLPSDADPHRLRPLALCLGRQRARGRAVRRAGQGGQDHGLCALGHLRRDRRPGAVVAADLGRPDRRHHLRADGDRRRRHRRRGADRRPRHGRAAPCSAPSSSASCRTAW